MNSRRPSLLDERLPQRLAKRLTRPLPGPAVGTRFEPRPLVGRHYDRSPPGARPAAVLLLLYPHEGRWHLPLTLRPATLADHAGQVSLPGGAIEEGESPYEAACREFHEELGVREAVFERLGRLSPVYIASSGFRVEPFLAYCRVRPPMRPEPSEVAELIEVPLEQLLDPAHFGAHERNRQGHCYTAPHFAFRRHRVWGATCMLLGELVLLLEDLAA